VLGEIKVVHKLEFLFTVGQRYGSFKGYNFLWIPNHRLGTTIIKKKLVVPQNLFPRLTPGCTTAPDNSNHTAPENIAPTAPPKNIV
jgi:hypothetical protein